MERAARRPATGLMEAAAMASTRGGEPHHRVAPLPPCGGWDISGSAPLDGKRDSMEDTGTRFRLYVQPPFVPGYEKPETIRLKAPAGSILAGPSNTRRYS